jgi:hypothetical protein
VDGEVRVRELTQRHWGRDKQEAARLGQLNCPNTELGKQDGYLTVMSGPLAGYELSVTRALGHKHMQQYGVIPEPHVATMELGSDDVCVVGGCRAGGVAGWMSKYACGGAQQAAFWAVPSKVQMITGGLSNKSAGQGRGPGAGRVQLLC